MIRRESGESYRQACRILTLQSTAARMLESEETSSSRTSMRDLMPSFFNSSTASSPACGERLPRR